MCFYLHLLTLFVIHIRTEKDKGISPCDVFAGRVKQKAKKISWEQQTGEAFESNRALYVKKGRVCVCVCVCGVCDGGGGVWGGAGWY